MRQSEPPLHPASLAQFSKDGVPYKAGEILKPCLREKPLGRMLVPVPRTNTGGQVENTKVSELTLVKELGKIVP